MQSTILQFARAVQQAIAYNSEGMSQIEAVTQACRTHELSTDWALPLHLILESSSTLASDWAESIIERSLDIKQEGAFR